MDANPLLRAIVGAMLLMEDSGPDDISQDTAVRGLENIGFELSKLTGSDRDYFLLLVERMADAESDAYTARFIRSIPFKIGMTEMPPE